MYGHQGKLLAVDLTSGHIEEETYPLIMRRFPGGTALPPR